MSDIFILYLWITYLFALGAIVEQIDSWSEITPTGYVYLILAPLLVPIQIGRSSINFINQNKG